jgi:hypothetical protein
MAFGGYSINGFWWLFYSWLLVLIPLMAFGAYSINDFWCLFH